MSTIELTTSQQRILNALVDLHNESDDAVKGERIAATIDRNAGTIRNQMQSLKALQLVEGVPGPKGGYKPTAEAYTTLDINQLEEAVDVPLYHNNTRVPDQTVEEIDLTNVHDPDECRAELHIQGSVTDFQQGDSVSVGPTPLSKLAIDGIVEATDQTNRVVVLKINDMRAPVENS